MKDTFTELSITADDELREHLVGILSQLGFEGFWEDADVLRCYIRSERWTNDMLHELRRIAATVQRASASAAPGFSIRTIENRNWNEEWERTIRPLHITERIVVAPTWNPYTPHGSEVLITIDPKMSFGTGDHETTRLVLRLMERRVRPGMRVLDIGTGTGILAIAAVRLGAAGALGIDTDEWSYANAIENVRLNNVEERVRILRGDLHVVDEHDFAMIVANIQRSVLEPLLPEIRDRLAPRGIVLLSGLLSEDEEPMRYALDRAGFTFAHALKENEWIALEATRAE